MRPSALLPCLLLLAACSAPDATPGPQATATASATARANDSEASASVDGIVLTARTLPMRNVSDAMAKRYGLDADPDALLLLVTLRDGNGDAVAVDGLAVDARVARLPDAPQPLALKRIEVGGMVDLVASVHARAPATLRFELDARRGGATSRLAFTRDVLPP